MSGLQSLIDGANETSGIPVTLLEVGGFPNAEDIAERGAEAITMKNRQVFFDRLKKNGMLPHDAQFEDVINDPLFDKGLLALNKSYIFALRIDDSTCLVGAPSFLDKDAFLKKALGEMYDPDKMPGTTEDWIDFVGRHEGEHCNHDTDSDDAFSVLRSEYRSDVSGIKSLMDDEKYDVAQAVIDIRIIKNVFNADSAHATGVQLAAFPSIILPTRQDLEIAEALPKIILDALGEDVSGLTADDAASKLYDLYKKDPQKFHDNLIEAHKNGAFDQGKLAEKFPNLSGTSSVTKIAGSLIGALGRVGKGVVPDPAYENEGTLLLPKNRAALPDYDTPRSAYAGDPGIAQGARMAGLNSQIPVVPDKTAAFTPRPVTEFTV